jgi:NNP family nitrate/nitrite transporter-like MFS transporter
MPGLPFPVLPLAFLTAIFYLNFVSRIILGPFLPVIEHELGLGHGGAGSLFLFIQIGYATGLLGSGLVSWRFTHRHTIVTSAVAVGIGMVGLSLAASLGTMRFWLVLGGAGAGLYLPAGVATITHLVNDAHWGKALAFHELAPNLAFITAPLLAEALFAAISWRGVLAVVGSARRVLCPFGPWGKPARRGAAPSDHGRSAARPIRVGHDAYLRRRGRVEPRRV